MGCALGLNSRQLLHKRQGEGHAQLSFCYCCICCTYTIQTRVQHRIQLCPPVLDTFDDLLNLILLSSGIGLQLLSAVDQHRGLHQAVATC